MEKNYNSMALQWREESDSKFWLQLQKRGEIKKHIVLNVRVTSE
jgi:hypothetical protein